MDIDQFGGCEEIFFNIPVSKDYSPKRKEFHKCLPSTHRIKVMESQG